MKLELLTKKIGDGIHATPKYIPTSEYYFINGNNLNNGSVEITDKTKCISEIEFQKYKNELEIGTILLSINGTIGNMAFYKNEKVLLGKSAAYLTVNSKLNKKYFYYQLSSHHVKKYFNKELTGTTIKNLSLKTLRNTKIPLPPLPEQKKIAQILTTLDSKINHIEAQITQTQTLKKGLMQQLLTKGIGHTEFKDSPLGEIPKSWEVVKIGDFLIEHKGGAALKPSDFVSENGFNVIPKKAVSIGGKLLIDEEKPKFCKLNFAKKNQRSIVDSSYLITTLRDLVPSGPNIGYIVKFSTKDKYILSQGVYGLKFNKDINEDFLIHFSNTATFRRVMQTIMVGSTQVHIRNSDYFKVEIPYPPLPEQKKIAQILSTVDSKIDLLENKRSEYQQLKKGMMQVLLTGEVRVVAD